MMKRERLAFVDQLRQGSDGVEVRAKSPGDRGVEVYFVLEDRESVPRFGRRLLVTIEDGESS